MAYQMGSPVVMAASQAATAAPNPQIGPAKPTRASSPTLAGYCFKRTNAPTNGMNIGALAAMLYLRSAMTWPISWM